MSPSRALTRGYGADQGLALRARSAGAGGGRPSRSVACVEIGSEDLLAQGEHMRKRHVQDRRLTVMRRHRGRVVKSRWTLAREVARVVPLFPVGSRSFAWWDCGGLGGTGERKRRQRQRYK